MKSLVVYIQEAIRKLPKSVSGIIVFDIDDTLLKVNGDMIRVYKTNPETGKEEALTTCSSSVRKGYQDKRHGKETDSIFDDRHYTFRYDRCLWKQGYEDPES